MEGFAKQSKRKVQPDKAVFDHRRTWGARLRTELRAMGKTPKWLGEQIYDSWSSIHQVLNGHQGVSREALEKILEIVPAMKAFWKPPVFVEAQGKGAPGPHKPHDYPDTGPRDPRRSGWEGQVRVAGRRLVAAVEANAQSIRVLVAEPLQPDEARRLGELLIIAAYHCDGMRDGASTSPPPHHEATPSRGRKVQKPANGGAVNPFS